MIYIASILKDDLQFGGMFFSVLIFNLLAIIYMVFRERRNPYSILVWTFAFLVFPICGLIFYIFIGQGPSLSKRKKFLRKVEDDKNYNLVLTNSFADFQKIVEPKFQLSLDLIKFNIKYNVSACGLFNNVKIYTDIAKQYEDMLLDIENAKEYINIQYFIYKKDNIGTILRDALVKKAKEGVIVRLIVDDIGSLFAERNYFKPLEEAGGEIVRFLSSRWGYLNRNVNYRNHRKIVVVDGKCAYTGGANIGDEYTNKTKRKWRDTHMRVEGDAVALLNIRFIQDYAYSSKKEVEKSSFKFPIHNVANILPMQIISSGPDTPTEEIKQTYIKLIYSAKKRLWFQTPYFIPDEAFKDALAVAVNSGIDVRIMIPEIPDKPLVYQATNSYVNDFVILGAKVYKYPAFLHSKTLVVDDQIATLGTFNIDIRSFKLHFESQCIMYGEEITRQMSDIFEKDMMVSRMVTIEDILRRKLWTRFKEGLMRILSPLL